MHFTGETSSRATSKVIAPNKPHRSLNSPTTKSGSSGTNRSDGGKTWTVVFDGTYTRKK